MHRPSPILAALIVPLVLGSTAPVPPRAETRPPSSHGILLGHRPRILAAESSGGGATAAAPAIGSSARPPSAIATALLHRLARTQRAGRVGVAVISLADGHVLYEANADRPLMPASTMKVLTAAAILEKLGPDWRYQTPFLADAPPADGVIAGDLYVKGVCEPDLVVERFPEIAIGLTGEGIHEIQGDLVADLVYFDGEERPPEWPDGSPKPYAAPISALAANFSSVRVTVLPGPRPAAPATVLVEPRSEAVQITANVRTVASGRTSLRAWRTMERAGDETAEVVNRIYVSGRIPVRAGPWERFLTIESPASVAISAVKSALQDGGIVVRGRTRLGHTPERAVPLYTLSSRPLSDIVLDMNKNSNNFIAEMLLRTLGAETLGPPGSRDKGTSSVAAFLRTCGIDPAALRLTDGSGLSRSNQLTASALARVLVRMWDDPRLGASFVASLPIGGVDGTLKGRLGGAALGRVRAKTGTIDGATTLAGYVEQTREGPVAFAFLVNGISHPRAVRLLDDLCRILCAP